MTNDYQNTKPQKIRFHVTAGEENIDLVNDLIQHFAKAKDYGVTYHKIKQRGKTPLIDLHCEIYEKNNTSFYRVLDYLVGSFNKDQLNEIEATLIHQFGES